MVGKQEEKKQAKKCARFFKIPASIFIRINNTRGERGERVARPHREAQSRGPIASPKKSSQQLLLVALADRRGQQGGDWVGAPSSILPWASAVHPFDYHAGRPLVVVCNVKLRLFIVIHS